MNTTKSNKKYNKIIIAVSVLIPIVVAVLFSVKLKDLGFNVSPLPFLPPIYACINALTALVLIAGVWAIKNEKKVLHQRFMTSAIALSLLFLVLYIAYHLTTDSVKFGDINHDNLVDVSEKATVGVLRFLYYFILISHILLSIAVIPLVLVTYVRALAASFESHKKIARITFPIWVYVAVTGVIVYVMISPYYV